MIPPELLSCHRACGRGAKIKAKGAVTTTPESVQPYNMQSMQEPGPRRTPDMQMPDRQFGAP